MTELMDAKAKVVAHVVFGKPEDYPPVAIQEYAGSISVIRDRVMEKARREGFHGDFVERMADLGWWLEPLIPLTDHEAALAELVAENRRLKVENQLKTRAIDRWVPCPDHRDKTNDQGCYMCQLERANKRNEHLLTGLEALAGEWEIRGLELESVGESEADFINAAALTSAANRLRRTLTNSAKDST